MPPEVKVIGRGGNLQPGSIPLPAMGRTMKKTIGLVCAVALLTISTAYGARRAYLAERELRTLRARIEISNQMMRTVSKGLKELSVPEAPAAYIKVLAPVWAGSLDFAVCVQVESECANITKPQNKQTPGGNHQ
jgi:hypothetical protein